jgi:hypothetical protein
VAKVVRGQHVDAAAQLKCKPAPLQCQFKATSIRSFLVTELANGMALEADENCPCAGGPNLAQTPGALAAIACSRVSQAARPRPCRP